MIHHSSLKSAGIFTPGYELILKEDGKHMLFDRRRDPEQRRNLHSAGGHSATSTELKRRTVEHHAAVKSPALGWLKGV